MSLPDPAIERVAAYFRALSDPTRLRILNALRDKACSVGELTELSQCSQANVSKHLKVLDEVGLITRQARGTTSWVTVADPAIFALCELVCDSVLRQLEKDVVLHRTLSGTRTQ